MSHWQLVRLGELYTVHNGLSKGREFFGKGFPFLTFTEVFNNWFLPEELKSLVQSTDHERSACSIKRGDVFITRTSETMDELGMSSVALKDYPNATYNGFAKRLRPITDRVLPEYIGYYLRSRKFRGKFMAFSSMTTRASLANEDLLSMEIEVPPKDVQAKIAQILSRYDSLIHNYESQLSLIEEAEQRLFKEWFLDFRYPGHEKDIFVDSIPEKWQEESILDNPYFHFAKCPVRRFDGEKTYYATADVDGTYVVNQGVNITYLGKPSRAQIQPAPYTVWFARMSKSYKILGFYNQNDARRAEAILSSGFAGFETTPDNYAYTYCLLSSKWFDEHKDRFATGATQVSLTNEGLSKIKALIPPKSLVEQFSIQCLPLIEKAILLREACFELAEARNLLLPKLISGEVKL